MDLRLFCFPVIANFFSVISLIFSYHGLNINHYVNKCQKNAKLQAIETFLLAEVAFFSTIHYG